MLAGSQQQKNYIGFAHVFYKANPSHAPEGRAKHREAVLAICHQL
jgi:hypothetical protein